MREDLPELDTWLLDMIFDRVYDRVEEVQALKPFGDEKLDDFLIALKAMQYFNYAHRHEDTYYIFAKMHGVLEFERNSEGTTLWLGLILAIKELYGIPVPKLRSLMRQMTIEK